MPAVIVLLSDGQNTTGPLPLDAAAIAVSRGVRRHAVLPEWAGAGIRLDALAPAAIMTPLLQEQLSNPRQDKAVRSFPVPTGRFGEAQHPGA